MRWMLSGVVFFLLSTPVKAFCLFGPCNYDECLDKYVVTAANETAARYLAATCLWEFRGDGFPNAHHERLADCYRDRLSKAGSELAARTAIQLCNQENPPPRPQPKRLDSSQSNSQQTVSPEKQRAVRETLDEIARKRTNERLRQYGLHPCQVYEKNKQLAELGIFPAPVKPDDCP